MPGSGPALLELQSRLASASEGVEGWLTLDEAWTLHEAARLAKAGSPIAVEIGSYKGRSAIALGLGILSKGGGRVYAIDPADMEPGQYEVFLENVKRAGVADVVEPIRSTSHDARPRFERSTVSVLFVDGSHEYDDVVLDIEDWTPTLCDGAVAAFNDPFWPGVALAMRDKLTRRNCPYRRPRWTSQTVFFDFAPNERWRAADSLAAFRLRLFVGLGRRWRSFHWSIVHRRRVPTWVKRLQLTAARGLFRMILPTVPAHGSGARRTRPSAS